MFDIGWSEMGLILLVALLVIGPKDLPRVARQVGRWTAKARAMTREFQRSLDDVAREAELQDIKAEIDKVTRADLRGEIERTIDPEGEMRRSSEPPRPAGRPEARGPGPALTAQTDEPPSATPSRVADTSAGSTERA